MKTMQEIFDFVVTKLAAQGCRSMAISLTNNTFCAYRGSRDRRCAIGWLIPDNKYNSDFEGYSLTMGIFGVLGLPGEMFQFLSELQKVHDHSGDFDWLPENVWDNSTGIASRFQRFAESWKLDSSILEKVWPR